MLLVELTIKELGYDPATLSLGSNKLMKIQCDYCQDTYDLSPKKRNLQNKSVNKDACNKCKYIKRDEIGIKDYGVTNPFARKDVKDKIKQQNIDKYGCEAFTQTEEFKEKAAKTNLERYGTEHAMQSEEIKAKHREVCMDKFGYENVSSVPEFQEKRKETCLEKYGNEHFLGSAEGREKSKDGMLEKFGVENAFQHPDIKEQIKQTHLEKRGVEYPTQDPDVRAKAIATNLEKYGVENVGQNEEFKQKIRESNLEKYGFEVATKSDEVKLKIRETRIATGDIKTYNGKTMKELAVEKDMFYSTFKSLVGKENNFARALNWEAYRTSLEQQMMGFLDSVGIEYSQKFRVGTKKPDFYIPSSKLLIEVDGVYWHSDANREDNYHYDKKKFYTANGFDSLFFRSDEMEDRFDIVCSIIKNRLKIDQTKLYARKCEVREVVENKKVFLNANHLMGAGKGRAFGLYFEGKLMSIMQVKPLEGLDYEISRFCHLKNHNVVGGFSKLLAHITPLIPMETMSTFIDLRYGKGNYLPNLGFVFQSDHKSFRWTIQYKTFSRQSFPGNSGYEAGANKIWDCGQARYIKQISKPTATTSN